MLYPHTCSTRLERCGVGCSCPTTDPTGVRTLRVVRAKTCYFTTSLDFLCQKREVGRVSKIYFFVISVRITEKSNFKLGLDVIQYDLCMITSLTPKPTLSLKSEVHKTWCCQMRLGVIYRDDYVRRPLWFVPKDSPWSH